MRTYCLSLLLLIMASLRVTATTAQKQVDLWHVTDSLPGCIAMKTYPGDTVLSDALRRLATQLNARYIQQYDYTGQPVYFLAINTLPAYELAQKGIATIDEKYYNSEGKLVATFRRATAGMYMRAQRWEPASFVPSKLVITKRKWLKKNDSYTLELPITSTQTIK